MAVSQRPGSRGPGTIYSSASLLSLLVIIVLAFSPATQTPPSIAEFAPQPREQITEAPQEQTSDFGSADGGAEIIEVEGTGDEPAPGPTIPEAEPEVLIPPEARTRRCVGDPPRQTEDPQSPPCIAFWAGDDNGGETWQGVTADTIRIAVPWQESGPGQGATEKTPEVQAIETFFNERFEFYGRRLELIPFEAHGTGEPMPEQQIADAVTADEELQVFASLPRADLSGADYYYYHELARRGIVSVYSGWGTSVTEAELQALHPYEWMVIPSSQEIAANQAEWACKNLLGHPVEYAPDFMGQDRVFGAIWLRGAEGTVPQLDQFNKRLDECGLDLAAAIEISAKGDELPSAVQNALLTLRTEGVNSVIVMTQATAQFLFIWPSASNQQYRPEWFISSIGSVVADSAALLAPKDQVVNSFGIMHENKPLLPPDRPANWALKEVDPSLDANGPFHKYTYWPLMVLASGIQWAGPNLTPDTFGAALQSLRFPNPGAGAAPYYQAHVGFENDHTFFDDAAVVWFSATDVSNETGQLGAYCYVDHGARFRLGEWPTTRFPLFQGDCY